MDLLVSTPRVAFFGNHDVGIEAFDGVRRCAGDILVVAHPENPEEGVRYASLYAHAVEREIRAIRGTASSDAVQKAIADFQPDLIWITDYRYLLPKQLLALAPAGAVNLHPSLLPAYRGRAPINWAILHGEHYIGLTAHLVDEGMDTGDILAQVRIELKAHEDVGDALEKLMPHYAALPEKVIGGLMSGTIDPVPQDHHNATTFSARKPADGLIQWSQTSEMIVNLIRAVSRPYPGAFSHHASLGIVHFWRAVAQAPSAPNQMRKPGTVISLEANELVVATGDGAVKISDWTLGENGPPQPPLTDGDVLW